jgi:hypothetical protein
MFAIVYDRHGIEETRYPLSDNDVLDCDIYADRFSQMIGHELDNGDGLLIPDGCEDYSVVLTDDPDNTSRCWTSRNYLLIPE